MTLDTVLGALDRRTMPGEKRGNDDDDDDGRTRFPFENSLSDFNGNESTHDIIHSSWQTGVRLTMMHYSLCISFGRIILYT